MCFRCYNKKSKKKCPKCIVKCGIQCSNNCETFFCYKCGNIFYEHCGEKIIGHNPECK